jgi:hypothetical protein
LNRTIGISLLLLILLTGSPGYAATVEASWIPVTKDVDGHPETISHYILYFGPEARPAEVNSPHNNSFEYENSRNVGRETTARQADLEPARTYYFAVTAVDIDGNISNYSPEARITIPAVPGSKTEPVVEKPAKEPEGGCATSGRQASLAVLLALVLIVFRKRLARLQ